MKILLTLTAELVSLCIGIYLLVKLAKWVLITALDYDNTKDTIQELYPGAYDIHVYKHDHMWHAVWTEQGELFKYEKTHTISGTHKSSLVDKLYREYRLNNNIPEPSDNPDWKPKYMHHD
jgi:hypothetical protein